jgi:hypothetical protein
VTTGRQELIAAAESLRDTHADQVALSTSRLLNPLLDLWSMAAEFGPEVSAPIEQLLTVYAGPRELASPAELDELVQRLRNAVDPALV